MPIQKSYLSIEHKSTFGVITSGECNIVYDASGKYAFSAALNDIHVWSLSEKKKMSTLSQPSNDSSNDVGAKPSKITCLALSDINNQIISGHHDGTIKVWDYKQETLLTTFNGHNRRVTCLAFNEDASKLASAGFDTDIIVWDMIAQRGLFRLRGHVKPVTDLQFIQINHVLLHNQTNPNTENTQAVQYTLDDADNEMLISSSRDASLKLWELETQHCVQTIVGHKNEVWAFDISKDKQFLVSGGQDSEVYVWKIEPHVISGEDLSDSEQQSDDDEDNDHDVDMDSKEEEKQEEAESKMVVSSVSSIRVRALGTVECAAKMGHNTRITRIRYNEQNNLLFAQTNGSMIQLFYCRRDQEIKKRLQIRKQKEKKQAKDKGVTDEQPEQEQTNEIEIKLEAADYLVGLTPIRCDHKVNSLDVCKALIGINSLKMKQSAKTSKTDNNDSDDSKVMLISNDDESKLEKLKQSLSANKLSATDVLLQPLLISYVNNIIAQIYIPVPAVTEDLSFIKLDEWRKKYLLHYTQLTKIEWEGHRTAVRSLCFSSDDTMIASSCKNELKVWNTRSMKCIRSLSSEYGLKCVFAPGNKHVIVATKQGNLLVYDLMLNELIQKVIGHEGEIYTMCLTADKTGIVSGGGDNCVKIWKFNLKMINNVKQLCITLRKSVKVQDEVLSVCVSPNGKYLAAALLDNTIQIFFFDTMKFYLTLFGHKLPVFGMDISTDSTILVSGSADKNIKIWGLDHGDCKKSLFAHSDSIIQIKFVVNTHYFYSCSKDGLVKYWDADKFRKIQEISGHDGEVWCMDLNSTGQLLVSAGADRSFRIHQESDEPLFALQEEQKQLEAMFDQEELGQDGKPKQPKAIAGSGLLDESQIESWKPGKKTMSAIDLGEALIEAIQVCDNEIERRKYCTANNKQYVMDARFRVGGIESVEQYMYRRLDVIPSADLEEVLMMLSFEYLPSIFYYLEWCIVNTMQIEKMVRCLLFLVKYHYQQLYSSEELKVQLKRLKEVAKQHLTEYRNRIGYNLQAMHYMQTVIKEKESYIQETFSRYKGADIRKKEMFETWKAQNAGESEEDDDEDVVDID